MVVTFGCPSEVVSDNGSQFVNELTSEFLDATYIVRGLTHAHSKEENGLDERANKEVHRHVSAVVFDSLVNNDWVQNIPLRKKDHELSSTHQCRSVT